MLYYIYIIHFPFNDEIRRYVWDNFQIIDSGVSLNTQCYDMTFKTTPLQFEQFLKIYGSQIHTYSKNHD